MTKFYFSKVHFKISMYIFWEDNYSFMFMKENKEDLVFHIRIDYVLRKRVFNPFLNLILFF